MLWYHFKWRWTAENRNLLKHICCSVENYFYLNDDTLITGSMKFWSFGELKWTGWMTFQHDRATPHFAWQAWAYLVGSYNNLLGLPIWCQILKFEGISHESWDLDIFKNVRSDFFCWGPHLQGISGLAIWTFIVKYFFIKKNHCLQNAKKYTFQWFFLKTNCAISFFWWLSIRAKRAFKSTNFKVNVDNFNICNNVNRCPPQIRNWSIFWNCSKVPFQTVYSAGKFCLGETVYYYILEILYSCL